MTMTINEEVLAVLRDCEMTEDSVAVSIHLSYTLWDAVDKVLTAAGGHWSPARGTYIFTVDPRVALGVAAAKGAVVPPMIQPSAELKAVMVSLDAGETANLEPALESLHAAVRLRRYIRRKVNAIDARKLGEILAALSAEAECDDLYRLLPPEWRW